MLFQDHFLIYYVNSADFVKIDNTAHESEALHNLKCFM